MSQQPARQGKVLSAVSAGGIVYRFVKGRLEILLCGRDEPRVWGLPKGMPNPGETLEEAAQREVAEETGLQATIEAKLGTIQYWFTSPQEKARYHKMVHYYLMAPHGGSLEQHDPEFDRVQWFPIQEVYPIMSYKNEAEMVAKAEALLAERNQPPKAGAS